MSSLTFAINSQHREPKPQQSFGKTVAERLRGWCYKLACVMFVALSTIPAHGAQATWVQKQRLKSASGQTLPTITVTGSINWGSGYWDGALSNSDSSYGGGAGVGAAIASSIDRALNLSSVCTNPAISSAAKSTTSKSDPTSRWLAAQEIFNSVRSANLLPMYGNATRAVNLLIDGKSYNGFRVQYSDGAQEVWVVNPGYATSSLKLFDSPAPNSMTPPVPSRGCNKG